MSGDINWTTKIWIMFHFYVHTKLFQTREHYSRGDIIQGRTLFKEIWYVDITSGLYYIYAVFPIPVIGKRNSLSASSIYHVSKTKTEKFITFFTFIQKFLCKLFICLYKGGSGTRKNLYHISLKKDLILSD